MIYELKKHPACDAIVSTLGEVVGRRGYFLKQRKRKRDGYHDLFVYENGEQKHALVHRLVAETFLPRIDGKEDVNHLDGNKSNNRLDNLEWCTPLENVTHASITGLRPMNGEDNHRVKLNADNVLNILRMWRHGHKQKDLAFDYGVNQTTISHICYGMSWTNVTGLTPVMRRRERQVRNKYGITVNNHYRHPRRVCKNTG